MEHCEQHETDFDMSLGTINDKYHVSKLIHSSVAFSTKTNNQLIPLFALTKLA